MTDPLTEKYADVADPGIRSFLIAGERLYPENAVSFTMAEQRASMTAIAPIFANPRPRHGCAGASLAVPCRRYVPAGMRQGRRCSICMAAASWWAASTAMTMSAPRSPMGPNRCRRGGLPAGPGTSLPRGLRRWLGGAETRWPKMGIRSLIIGGRQCGRQSRGGDGHPGARRGGPGLEGDRS
jgi:hypothetical protein